MSVFSLAVLNKNMYNLDVVFMKKKSNKNNLLSFRKYLCIFIVILSAIVSGLVYFINVFPLEYFLVFISLIIIIDLIVISLILSKGHIKNVIGGFFALILIVIMTLGINYGLNTMDFLKSFGFSDYKTESYSVLVLSSSKFKSVSDLKNKTIGYLSKDNNEGLSKVVDKIKKKINYKEKIEEDVDSLITNLINEKVDAIVIDDARLDILKEENNEEYNLLKKIGSYSIDVKSEKIGKEVDVTNSSFNIYVSGIDTYGSINKVSRSDVNILITVNPVTKEILLTNIPRDYYVKLHKNGEYDKLTHAGIYGIDESINTLEDLFDTKINYYVKVNFTSLVDIVDALDGITVNSPYSFVSQDGYSYKKGDNILDGKKALSFARERKSFKEGDRTRGENQQRVLTALINKAMSPKIITNYTNLLTSLKGKFVTNISDEDITKLIKMQLKNNSSWTIKSISVNGTDAMDYVYSYNKTKLYVMKPDYETVNNAKEQIKKVQDKKG